MKVQSFEIPYYSYTNRCLQFENLIMKEENKYFLKVKNIAISKGGECISEKYKNSNTKLKFKCSKGHIWEATPNSSERKSTTYDFVTETCKEKNATIIVLDQLEIFNKIYNDVLKISFNKTFSANDIKTIFYSKGHGVIKFIKENKNTFVIN